MKYLIGATLLGCAGAVVNYTAVSADIKQVLTTYQPNVNYPQDSGNYGPFFIRLAWHSAGSYRSGDGRGGSDGGRQRFEPENIWVDNGNLDFARELLQGVKDKYPDLTWADLMVLSGVVAVDAMGGPNIGFCGGRVDDVDGTESLPLGPGPEQILIAPCETDGRCGTQNSEINGGVELGLIYVNPEGVHAKNGTIIPDPSLSVNDVRGTFARMGMDDWETVALIGGGHAFGKTHGNSSGTFTSGFEGPWTADPTNWDKDYFEYINMDGWEKERNPWNTKNNGTAAPYQWKNSNSAVPPKVRMLTSDLALGPLGNDASYMEISKALKNITLLEKHFGAAWYKLLSRDMGPHVRCQGELVPPPQPWQLPLPPANTSYPDWANVAFEILAAADTDAKVDSLIDLAYQCGKTYRYFDFMGGCNGAFIFQEPVKSFVDASVVELTKDMLAPIKAKFPSLSWADLVVFAGQLAVKKTTGATSMKFCPGRSDSAVLSEAQMRQVAFLKVREFANKAVELSELRLRLEMSLDEIRAVLQVTNDTTYDSEFTGELPDAMAAKVAAWTKLMNLGRFEVDCATTSIDIPDPSPDATTTTTTNTNTTTTTSAGSAVSPLFLLLGLSAVAFI